MSTAKAFRRVYHSYDTNLKSKRIRYNDNHFAGGKQLVYCISVLLFCLEDPIGYFTPFDLNPDSSGNVIFAEEQIVILIPPNFLLQESDRLIRLTLDTVPGSAVPQGLLLTNPQDITVQDSTREWTQIIHLAMYNMDTNHYMSIKYLKGLIVNLCA